MRAAAASLLMTWCTCAMALDPSLDISQYGHTAWRNRDGFAPSTISVIAQTPDGYLWLGTPVGLFRFDGVRSVGFQPPAGSALPDSRVRALLVSRDGTLWIGLWRGLASWKEGKLTTYRRFDDKTVNDLVENDDGTLWVGGAEWAPERAVLCALRADNVECKGEDGSLGRYIGSLNRDARGALWMFGGDRARRLKPGPFLDLRLPGMVTALQPIGAMPDGSLLIPTSAGMARLVGERIEPYPIVPFTPAYRPRKAFVDGKGGLWIAVGDHGLLHQHGGLVDAFVAADGLTGDAVASFFEDREGNIWVGTNGGLDQFSPTAAVSYSAGQGISGPVGSVLGARDGVVWIATATGLYRVREGRVADIRPVEGASLFEDHQGRIWVGDTGGLGYLQGERLVRVDAVAPGQIDAMAEDARGNLWIAHRTQGLLRLSPDAKIAARWPWIEFGRDVPGKAIAVDPRDASIWVGFFEGGIARVVDGRVRVPKAVNERLPKRRVSQIEVEPDGSLWLATEQGLAHVAGDEVSVLDGKGGLPCDAIGGIVLDRDWAWLSMPCGLVQVARGELRAWAGAAQGHGEARVRARVFDRADGIRAVAGPGTFMPHMARARDGRIWLMTQDGATVVDPAHLPSNRVVPPVHVESIVADRVAYDPASVPRARGTPMSALRLPPLPRDIEIAYTATSFTVPERVQFKYMLEGRDKGWVEAGNARRAYYTDLPPGDYRFRVLAANDSGVWNEQGDALAFSIAPAWWQTNWFRVSLAAAIALLLYAIYRLRVKAIARRFNETLDARVNERMRIARDLHDTLLQSFHGLLLRFQTASQLWPSSEGKAVLDKTIDQAAEAVTEGRDAVQGLRASATEVNDLASALRTLGETLATEHGNGDSPTLRVEVQGITRNLHPILRDEVFRIASEALRNAFHHAHANHVEVEIRYDVREMRVRIRDDGKGMDANVLRQGGREGHFGMGGMRERAKLVGGKLTIWSAQDAGTEVELAIPASHAYLEAGAVSER
jgi:signal transduction histidine kinase